MADERQREEFIETIRASVWNLLFSLEFGWVEILEPEIPNCDLRSWSPLKNAGGNQRGTFSIIWVQTQTNGNDTWRRR
jgi:hypothetical protein